jgi:tubulin polyglutamylase TTLL4
MGIDVEKLFEKIKDIIIKTCIAVEPYMLNSINRSPEHKNNCFELYGFDILIDANLKPWLLECNVCPSLSSSSPLDKRIKTCLLSDILNMVGFYPYNKKKLRIDTKKNSIQNSLGGDEKKLFSKNIKDLNDLDAGNCV